jgi:hypothetical protein
LALHLRGQYSSSTSWMCPCWRRRKNFNFWDAQRVAQQHRPTTGLPWTSPMSFSSGSTPSTTAASTIDQSSMLSSNTLSRDRSPPRSLGGGRGGRGRGAARGAGRGRARGRGRGRGRGRSTSFGSMSSPLAKDANIASM